MPIALERQPSGRCIRALRETRESRVELRLDLDRPDFEGQPDADSISTGLPFLDHMLDALSKHGGFALELKTRGDLHVDDHHSVEDTALTLGAAFDALLEERSELVRFGSAYAPLDEALARSVVDLSGRPFTRVELGLRGERLGSLATENLTHFLERFAMTSRTTLHIDVLQGRNDHHRAEAAFKATALALRAALQRRPAGGVASTKGSLG